VQAAVITAEEYPESERPAINADALGRVRVRFPWDQRPDGNDQKPTSEWIRVSQFWAGASYGALYTPRVGHEVLVAYMQGDPDRPVIVGRVYNPQHPPPYDASKDPTKSTVKSQSAETKKEVDGFNEIRFEDRAKKEEIFLHAQRDFNEVVLASHSTSVGGDQSNSVGGNQSNSVKGHREHTITGYEKVTVGADRTTIFKADEYHKVSGDRSTDIGASETLIVHNNRDKTVGANETNGVVGFRLTTIGANDDLHVGGWHNTLVGASETLKVGGDRFVTVSGGYGVTTGTDYTSEAGGNHAFRSTNTYFYPAGDFQVSSTTAGFNQGASFYVKAGGCTLTMGGGVIALNNGAGSSIVLAGGNVVINAGAGMVTIVGGPSITTTGGPVVVAGGDINATAPNIHLNG